MCPGGRPGQLPVPPFLGLEAEQSWVGGFEDSSPLFSRDPVCCRLGEYWPCVHSILVASPLLALLGAGSDLTAACLLLLSWGFRLAITRPAAVALKKIGYDASDVSVAGWCWINLEAEDRVLWMLLTGKLWELLAYIPFCRALPPHPEAHPPGGRCPRGAAQSSVWPVCPRDESRPSRGRTERPARVREGLFCITHRDACRISSALLLVWI